MGFSVGVGWLEGLSLLIGIQRWVGIPARVARLGFVLGSRGVCLGGLCLPSSVVFLGVKLVEVGVCCVLVQTGAWG